VRNITEWLRRAYEKVSRHVPKPTTDYSSVPKAARVSNTLSNRARFAHCLIRRVGYAAHVATADLAAVEYKPLTSQRYHWMLNAWLKGVTWAPILIEAVVEDGRWMVKDIKNYDVCLFLKDRQRMMVVQVVEPGFPSGTNEKMSLLNAGLYFPDGKHCPIVFGRVVL